MKLVVFLGNAGTEYAKNRHNLGFMVGDFFAKENGAKWKFEKKFGAEVAVIASNAKQSSQKSHLDRHADKSARDDKVILVKPQFFYNRTGEVVSKIAQFYKIEPQDILAVCDDFNLEFGKIRYRKQGGAGGSNGLKSIINHIGEGFARIRIGTDNELRKTIGETDFVLSDFSKSESKQLPEIISEATEIINNFI